MHAPPPTTSAPPPSTDRVVARAHPLGLFVTPLAGASAIATAWCIAPRVPVGPERLHLQGAIDRHQFRWAVHELVDWLVREPRSALALEVLRGGLWLLGTYLLAASALLVVARLDPTGWIGTVTRACTPETLRQLAGMGTLAIAGTVGTLPVIQSAPPGPVAVATIRALPVHEATGPAPVLRTPPAPRVWPGRASSPSAQSDPRLRVPRTSHWVVQPGQSFWSEAEALVASSTNPPDPEPPLPRVAACWLELERLNRSRLVRPGDFDLIEPGQAMRRPPDDECGAG